MSQNKGGDVLARGSVRCQFAPVDSKKVSQEAWDAAFNDFDAEKYCSNADAPANGDAGIGVRETARR